MKKLIALIAGAALLIVLILFSTTYTVRFHEVAVKTRFGTAEGEASVVREPGLHVRLPFFIDRVKRFDTRVQFIETPLETVLTQDGLQVLVRSYALWRVNDEGAGPLEFLEEYGSVESAQQLLAGQFRTAMNALSRYRFDDLVGQGSRLAEAEAAMTEALRANATRGIRIDSVGISQVLLPQTTTRFVLERMEATRTALAEQERSAGTAEASRIRSDANSQADKIRAFANQRAQQLMAEGDQLAATYLEQMAKAEDLAILLAQLRAFEEALSQQTTVVLSAENAPWHLIDTSSPLTASGIPVPAGSVGGEAVAVDGQSRPGLPTSETEGR